VHPLEPGESFTFHVEGSNTKTLFFCSVMKLKKLFDLKDPAECFSTIELGYVEFYGSGGKIVWLPCVCCNVVESRRTQTCSHLVHLCSEICHVCLEISLVNEKLIECFKDSGGVIEAIAMKAPNVRMQMESIN